ncbi:hypothetical protein CRV01_10970 [Arcobacter sp. CECT 8983]|uniref:hypothetical protein n=1 Tax=Arcobacter sp. CECT 8983 TaxID=2044508 RepID=UPI00100B814D|nr:hypothetical protein [Arcobacter sp. CECT 8983]RXJ89130.1 hypothetical protein CRV01_10970 [Arcobacter sp. CECT 8983]
MVKIVFILFYFTIFLNANSIYENNCVSCHKKLPVSIDKYFYRYLLKYSSERSVKEAMATYLNNPTKETTIMPEAFIKRFGVKKATTLNNSDLTKALDIYWDKYKVFGKLE